VIPEHWRTVATAPPRAGQPAGGARIRATADDFRVDELLGFAASGAGEHVLLRVRKRDANTAWVARELARMAGARPADVGYAGLKDRHAVTTQWFTVPGRRRPAAAWAGVAGEGFEVVEAAPHSRKLPRGALAGNRFRIVLRDFSGDPVALATRVGEVAAAGVPNYFGPQRFGRDSSNLRAVFEQPEGSSRGGRRPDRDGLVLSAARSLVFNAVLAERVRDGSWNCLREGDRANLDGRNSVFALTAPPDADLLARQAALDVHPTGPLPGRGDSGTTGDVRRLEEAVAERYPEAMRLIDAAGVEAARRPLRLAVRDLRLEAAEDGTCALEFSLRAGGFATVVLRELVDTEALEETGHD
jgi:tRNA pseudouridine13 synthase